MVQKRHNFINSKSCATRPTPLKSWEWALFHTGSGPLVLGIPGSVGCYRFYPKNHSARKSPRKHKTTTRRPSVTNRPVLNEYLLAVLDHLVVCVWIDETRGILQIDARIHKTHRCACPNLIHSISLPLLVTANSIWAPTTPGVESCRVPQSLVCLFVDVVYWVDLCRGPRGLFHVLDSVRILVCTLFSAFCNISPSLMVFVPF